MIRKSIPAIISIISAITITLLIAELVTRLFITSPSNQVYDPVLGWRYIPHTKILHSKEGFARNSVNSQGLVDRELSGDVGLRVLVLGDSYVEAVQIPGERNFTSLLEQHYADSDFINAGRSDVDAADLEPIAEHYLALDPTEILVVLNADDVAGLLDSDIKVEYLNGEIVAMQASAPEKDQIKRRIEPLMQSSALITYMARRLKPVILDIAHSFEKEEIEDLPTATAIDGIQKNSTEYLARLEFILRRLNEMRPTTVLFLPYMEFHAQRVSEEVDFSTQVGDLILQACRKTGTEFIRAGTSLAASYRESGKPPFGFANTLPGSGHLNEDGHRAVATAVINSVTFDK